MKPPGMGQSSTTNVKLNDLSVVGREIINSQVKPGGAALFHGTGAIENNGSGQTQSNGRFKSQTAGGLPIDE